MKKSRLNTVVISLDTATARRSWISRTLEGSPVDWSFFDAHRALSAPELSHDNGLTRRRFGRSLGQEEIAVYSSHYAVISSFLKNSQFDFLLVLEDDVLIDAAFPLEEFATYCSSLGMDYIRVFGRHYAPAHEIGYFHDRNMIRYKTSPRGAQAYILTKRGARILANALRQVDTTIDIAMDRFWRMDLPIYGIFPYPVIERYSPTQIPIPTQADDLSAYESGASIAFRLKQKFQKIVGDWALLPSDSRIRKKAQRFEQIGNSPGLQITSHIEA